MYYFKSSVKILVCTTIALSSYIRCARTIVIQLIRLWSLSHYLCSIRGSFNATRVKTHPLHETAYTKIPQKRSGLISLIRNSFLYSSVRRPFSRSHAWCIICTWDRFHWLQGGRAHVMPPGEQLKSAIIGSQTAYQYRRTDRPTIINFFDRGCLRSGGARYGAFIGSFITSPSAAPYSPIDFRGINSNKDIKALDFFGPPNGVIWIRKQSAGPRRRVDPVRPTVKFRPRFIVGGGPVTAAAM